MSKSKKQASCDQEYMVADYLGWKVVSGSGARPFRPGDVQNEHYLVECKTHVDRQLNIVFQKNHWKKIAIEARSVNKYPALITDNGSQKSVATWVTIPLSAVPVEKINKLFGLNNTARTNSTITFDHSSTLSQFKSLYKDECINCFTEWFDDARLAIMPLEEFSKFYHEEFEC